MTFNGRMNFAIALTGNGNYMLVRFNEYAQRDTVVKYSNGFIPISKDEVKQYISKDVIHLCKTNHAVVYNQNGVRCGKFESLYKPLHQQASYKPEKYASIFAPKANYGYHIINKDKQINIKK